MLGIMKGTILAMIACLAFFRPFAFAQDVPSDYQEILKFLDRKGDFKDGVLKVKFHAALSKSPSKVWQPPLHLGLGVGLLSQKQPRAAKL